MVVLEEPELEHFSIPRPHKLPNTYDNSFVIPLINLEEHGCETKLVRACEELGFFKVTNHGVPKELMAQVEAEAMKFFNKPQHEKESAGHANPYGYGNTRIGCNGDIGRVEYLLFEINSNPVSHTSLAFLTEPSSSIFLYDPQLYTKRSWMESHIATMSP